jgi:hypothetical protein
MATLAVAVEQVYNRMVELGFFKYFLPWLLAFVVIYGILRSIDIFDAEETDDWHKRIYGLMSAIISTLVVAYVPFQTGAFATFLSTYFGSISLILMVIIGFVLIYGLMTGTSPHEHFKEGRNWVAWAVGITVLFLLFSSGFFGVLFWKL